MVPVEGAGKDRGHDAHGPKTMRSGCGYGRKGICRFPAGVTLPEHYRF